MRDKWQESITVWKKNPNKNIIHIINSSVGLSYTVQRRYKRMLIFKEAIIRVRKK